MWCVPHPTKENHTLVLLDTEGLGDVEKGDKKNDIWIFCLAVLLSSALVYNSIGTIDQDAIEKLHYVKELTDRIKVKSSDDDDDDEVEFSKHFPIFIWTVRDFNLKVEINGKPVTEDEYLEHALKLKEPEKTLKDQNFNFPRKCIRMYFGRRKCFVFDPPAGKDILQRIEEVSDSDLSPDFVAQTKKFCEFIFNNAEAKELDRIQTVTGTILGNLAKTYTEAISRGDAPCMENAVLTLSEIENKAAVEEATQYYENQMRKKASFPTENMEQFMNLSIECEKEAIQIFMKKSFKDKDHYFQGKLMENIQESKSRFSKQNETESREQCKMLIKNLSDDLEKDINGGSYCIPGGHQKFKKAIQMIKEKYNKEPRKGIQAEDVLQKFLKSKQSTEMTILKSDNALAEKEKVIEEEKAKAEAREMEKKVFEENKSQENQRLQDQRRVLEENAKQLFEKIEMERKKMFDDMNRIINEKRREQESFRQQESIGQVRMYQAQIEDLEKEKNKSNEPAWYEPIFEGVKDMAKLVLPTLFDVCGDVINTQLKKYKNKKIESEDSSAKNEKK
ncbi:guanylate-binding protein 1-like [Discoglossus pictus]